MLTQNWNISILKIAFISIKAIKKRKLGMNIMEGGQRFNNENYEHC